MSGMDFLYTKTVYDFTMDEIQAAYTLWLGQRLEKEDLQLVEDSEQFAVVLEAGTAVLVWHQGIPGWLYVPVTTPDTVPLRDAVADLEQTVDVIQKLSNTVASFDSWVASWDRTGATEFKIHSHLKGKTRHYQALVSSTVAGESTVATEALILARLKVMSDG